MNTIATEKQKKTKKYVLLDLMNESEKDNNTIIGALDEEQYRIYCHELYNASENRKNEPRITKDEFKKIIKRIKENK